MPKTRPIYREDQPFAATNSLRSTAGTSTISGVGVSDHGALTGLGDDDHTQYHNNARGDARYYTQTLIDGLFTTHAALPNAHHNRSHDILGASDHTLTASQYQIIGATATDTLGLLTPGSDGSAGNTILITDANGDLQISDLTAVDGTFTGTLGVTGAATLSSTLGVTGTATFSGDLDAGGLDWDTSSKELWLNVGSAPNDTSAARIQAADTTHTTLTVRKITNQSGDLVQFLDDSGGGLIKLTAAGALESGSITYEANESGWYIGPDGYAEFNDAHVRGTLSSTVFVADEQIAIDGSMIISAGGTARLHEAYTISAAVDPDDVSKPTGTLKVDLPATGGTFQQFKSGDVLHIRTLANVPSTTSANSPIADFWSLSSPTANSLLKAEVWMTITADGTLYSDRIEYAVRIEKAPACDVPKGTVVVSLGQFTDDDDRPGYIRLSALQPTGPLINMVTMANNEPWDAANLRTHVQIGLIERATSWFGTEASWGFKAGVDLGDEDEPYFYADQNGVTLYKSDLTWKVPDGEGGNIQTGSITSDGSLAFGSNISSDETKAFRFDAATGDVIIGSVESGEYMQFDASLGRLIISDSVHIPTGSVTLTYEGSGGVKSTLPDWLADFAEAPSSAGLYLTGSYLGYYDGSAWDTFITATGDFHFGGTSGARLEWDGSTFSGYSATGRQFYMSASSGKLLSNGGKVALDEDGIGLSFYSGTWSPGTEDESAITWNSGSAAVVAGERLWGSGLNTRYLALDVEGEATAESLRNSEATLSAKLDAVTVQIELNAESNQNNRTITLDPGGGLIYLEDIPTSDPASAGALWRSGTALQISLG